MVLPSFLSPVHRKLAEKLLGIGTLTKLIAKTASCEDMRCQAHITVAVQYQIRTGFPSAQSILSFYCLAFFICRKLCNSNTYYL